MPDLDSLKRSVDLTQYLRAKGYQERPRDGAPGITVLEHEGHADRIAVARLASGGIYARIPDYAPRGASESEETAWHRLRDCITRSSDTGSIVEFVRSSERRAGRPEPDAERLRDHLATWQQIARNLDRSADPHPERSALHRRIGDWRPSSSSEGPVDASEVQARLRRWQDAQRAIDRKLARGAELAAPTPLPASNAAPRPTSELARRRYDWSPPASQKVAPDRARHIRARGGPERGR